MNKTLYWLSRPSARRSVYTHTNASLYSEYRNFSTALPCSINQVDHEPTKDKASSKGLESIHKRSARNQGNRLGPERHSENLAKTSEIVRKWIQEGPNLIEQSQRHMPEKRLDRLRGKLTGQILAHAHLRNNPICCFQLSVGYLWISIPVRVAAAWNLIDVPNKDRLVKLTAHVTDNAHPHVWAQKSIESDDGCRLGLTIQYASYKPTWLKINTAAGVASANTIVDLVTGKIKNPNTHTWTADRLPFLGPWAPYVSTGSWRESFEDPDKRRDAISRGETLTYSWKPTDAYLQYYKTFCSVEQPGPGEPPPLLPTYIDPLNAPTPPPINRVKRAMKVERYGEACTRSIVRI